MLCKELERFKEVINMELPKGIKVEYVSPKTLVGEYRCTIERVDNVLSAQAK